MKLSPGRLFPLILLCALIIFFNALNHPFMLDDHAFFQQLNGYTSQVLEEFNPNNTSQAANISGSSTRAYYRPLSHILPKALYVIFQGDAFLIHLFNLILFASALTMVAVFIRGYLGLGVALLMMAHPINGIVVNYKTAGIFALQIILMTGAMGLLRSSFQSYSKQLVSGLLFLGALFCHESAFIMPILLAGLLVVVEGLSVMQALKRSLPILITCGAYFIFRLNFASLSDNLWMRFDGYGMNLFEYLASIFNLQLTYLHQFLTLKGIVIFTLLPIVREHIFIWLSCGLLAWAGILYFIFSGKYLQPWLRCGLWWFSAGLWMCAIGGLFHGKQLMMEAHWMIYPSIGLFVLCAGLLHQLLQHTSKPIGLVIIMGVFLSLITSSWSYNERWQSEAGYCRFWKAQNPSNFQINSFLANAYAREGNDEGAISTYKDMVGDNQEHFLVHAQLGNLYLGKGRLDEARAELETALRLNPSAWPVLNTLGIIAYNQGDKPKAKFYFIEALKINPNEPSLKQNLEAFKQYNP